MYCRTCGNEVSEKAIMCVACGTPPKAGDKFCWNCKSETTSDAAICMKCGVSLRDESLNVTQTIEKNQEIEGNIKPLPNALATLILGICSILFGCFLVGFICGIIGLAISGRSNRLYGQTPNQFSGHGMLKAGRILSIIGIVLGAIVIIWTIVWVVIFGNGMFDYLDYIGY